jgi:hypothetical protein
MVYIVPLELSTMGIIFKKEREREDSLKLLSLHPGLYLLMHIK